MCVNSCCSFVCAHQPKHLLTHTHTHAYTQQTPESVSTWQTKTNVGMESTKNSVAAFTTPLHPPIKWIYTSAFTF